MNKSTITMAECAKASRLSKWLCTTETLAPKRKENDMTQRAPTKITVKVLDLSGIAKRVLDAHNAKNPTAPADSMIYRPHGIIETSRGVYLLDNEGIGSAMPVTQGDGTQIAFNPQFEKDGYSSTSFESWVSAVGPDDLKALPVIEEKNLAEFVRTFGARLNRNYEEWRRAMEKEITL